jgi:hypothetical protein
MTTGAEMEKVVWLDEAERWPTDGGDSTFMAATHPVDSRRSEVKWFSEKPAALLATGMLPYAAACGLFLAVLCCLLLRRCIRRSSDRTKMLLAQKWECCYVWSAMMLGLPPLHPKYV